MEPSDQAPDAQQSVLQTFHELVSKLPGLAAGPSARQGVSPSGSLCQPERPCYQNGFLVLGCRQQCSASGRCRLLMPLRAQLIAAAWRRCARSSRRAAASAAATHSDTVLMGFLSVLNIGCPDETRMPGGPCNVLARPVVAEGVQRVMCRMDAAARKNRCLGEVHQEQRCCGPGTCTATLAGRLPACASPAHDGGMHAASEVDSCGARPNRAQVHEPARRVRAGREDAHVLGLRGRATMGASASARRGRGTGRPAGRCRPAGRRSVHAEGSWPVGSRGEACVYMHVWGRATCA